MEFGSKEWMEEANNNFNFPCTMAFYIDNNLDVNSSEVNGIREYVRFKTVDPEDFIMSDGNNIALLGLRYLENANDYYDACVHFKNNWK